LIFSKIKYFGVTKVRGNAGRLTMVVYGDFQLFWRGSFIEIDSADEWCSKFCRELSRLAMVAHWDFRSLEYGSLIWLDSADDIVIKFQFMFHFLGKSCCV